MLGFGYIAVQFLGHICGGLLAYFFTGTGGALVPDEEASIAAAAIVEVIGTFVFVLVILIQTDAKTRYTEEPILIFLSIASTLGAVGTLAGPVSGGCINPADGFGINLAMFIETGDGEAFKYIWMYLLMPLLGAAIATLSYDYVYRLTDPDDAEDEREPLKDNPK